MIIFSILILSVILAYLMRLGDIYVSFRKEKIKLSLSDCLKILLLLTNNFLKISLHELKNKNKKLLKVLLKSFIFNFDLSLTLLSSIVSESIKSEKAEQATLVPVKKDDNVLVIIKKSFPLFNSKQKELSFT